MRRWLTQDALKPWQHQSWIFITDPDFRAKAAQVLDLYARPWNGEPLGEDEYVISADERPPFRPAADAAPACPGNARTLRVNHAYRRSGALAYLAAYDVHHARVLSRTEERTGIVPFMNLATQVMSTEPYARTKRVYWIADKRLLPPRENHRRHPTRSWSPDRVTPHLKRCRGGDQ